MSKKTKLAEKLRIYKAIHKVKNKDIALALGISKEHVSNWCRDNTCPEVLNSANAAGLVAFTENYITMKDCGR